MAETEDLIFDSNGIYIPQIWSDELVDSTAITPQRLDHIEQGIKGTSESLKNFSDSISQEISKKTTFTGSKKYTAVYSIGANAHADAKFTIPNNLEIVSLCGYSSGNYYITVSQVDVTNGSANMRLFNETNTQINNQTAAIIVNCRTR